MIIVAEAATAVVDCTVLDMPRIFNGGTDTVKIIDSSQKSLISLTLGGFECCKCCTRETNMVGTKFSWFGWPSFYGARGKVLHWLFPIVGMACQSQNVNNGTPDNRVARS